MINNSQIWYVGKHPRINISDSIDLDSSETYASSKSVSTLNKKINSYHNESSLSNSNTLLSIITSKAFIASSYLTPLESNPYVLLS